MQIVISVIVFLGMCMLMSTKEQRAAVAPAVDRWVVGISVPISILTIFFCLVILFTS